MALSDQPDLPGFPGDEPWDAIENLLPKGDVPDDIHREAVEALRYLLAVYGSPKPNAAPTVPKLEQGSATDEVHRKALVALDFFWRAAGDKQGETEP